MLRDSRQLGLSCTVATQRLNLPSLMRVSISHFSPRRPCHRSRQRGIHPERGRAASARRQVLLPLVSGYKLAGKLYRAAPSPRLTAIHTNIFLSFDIPITSSSRTHSGTRRPMTSATTASVPRVSTTTPTAGESPRPRGPSTARSEIAKHQKRATASPSARVFQNREKY